MDTRHYRLKVLYWEIFSRGEAFSVERPRNFFVLRWFNFMGQSVFDFSPGLISRISPFSVFR